MDPNNSQKTAEDDLLDDFADGMDPKELAKENQKLKAELQQIKEANSNQVRGTSMMQMVWQMGMQTGELKNEMDGLKKEVWKLTEENTGLKRKLAKVEEEFVGKNAKFDEMEKEMKKIGAKNAELEGKIVEKAVLEGTMRELQKQKANKETPVDLTESIDGMEFFQFYPNELKNNKWNAADCGHKLVISDEGGLFVKKNGPKRDNSIRAISPIPPFNLNVTKPSIAGYFEVQIVHKNPKRFTTFSVSIGIGFCNKQFPLEGKWLGNEENSIGIYCTAGMVISGQLKGFGSATEYFKIGDVIGVGIIHSTANTSLKCFATLNGKLLGTIELSPNFATLELFPAVSLETCGDSIRTNFGQEKWLFNASQLLQ